MTAAYDAQIDAAARAPLWLVQITTAKRCANTYANDDAPSTCTASDAGDGARCYFSRKTCQDAANFRPDGDFTWSFISADLKPWLSLFGEITPLYPLVKDVSHVQQQVELAGGATKGGFTRPDKLTVTMFDVGGESGACPSFDLDKSVRNTGTAGHFWRRWIAQWPNFRNMTVTVKRGFYTSSFTAADFAAYWGGTLEDFSIDHSGVVKLSCVDWLRAVEKQLPKKISSSVKLLADMSRSATSLTVADASQFTDPDDITGDVCVEFTTFTGRQEKAIVTAVDIGSDPNTLTVTRGAFGTIAEPVRDGTEIREILCYASDDGVTGLRPNTIILDLLNRVGVASANINTMSFDDAADWIGPSLLKRTVREPEEVRKLIQEIAELYQAFLYIDPTQKVSMGIKRPAEIGETIGTITDATNIVSGSGDLKIQERGRLTHVAVFFDYPDDDSSSNDWNKLQVAINGETFDAEFYGAGEEDRQEKRIESRWIRSEDEGGAQAIAVHLSMVYATPPLRFGWTAELRDADTDIGDVLDVTTVDIQDEHGASAERRMVVVSKQNVGLHAFKFQAEDTSYDGTQRIFVIGANTLPDYDSASAAEKLYGYFGDGDLGATTSTVGAANDDGYYIS